MITQQQRRHTLFLPLNSMTELFNCYCTVRRTMRRCNASQEVDIRNSDVIQFMCVTRGEVRPEVAEVVAGCFFRILSRSANVLVFLNSGCKQMLGSCLLCLVVTVRGTR